MRVRITNPDGDSLIKNRLSTVQFLVKKFENLEQVDLAIDTIYQQGKIELMTLKGYYILEMIENE